MRRLIVILGPTASGKSALGVKLAKQFNGTVISADSRQVYRGLNIGAAKITKTEMGGVPHYLLDVASPRGQYSVARYAMDVARVLKNIPASTPIFLVGGSPFYIKAVTQPGSFSTIKPDLALRRRLENKSTAHLSARLRQMDPERWQHIDPANRRRLIRAIEIASAAPLPEGGRPQAGGVGKSPPLIRGGGGVVKQPERLEILKIGLNIPRHKLYERIDRRVDQRLDGIIRETKKLHRQGLSWKRLDAFGLEYRFASRYLQKRISRSAMASQLKSATHAFARRQLTWWRKEKDIHWLSSELAINRSVRKFLQA